MRVILASNNQGKIKEFKEILSKFNIEIISLKDIGFNDEIIESGTTFQENALIKAKTIFDKYKLPVIADDSGLCVRALNYAPGIYSARYNGMENGSEKNNYLISQMKDYSDRYAYFACSIILYLETNLYYHFEGKVEGMINDMEKGDNGFGFDPIFIPKGYDKTFAEMDNETKNKISHRGLAVKAMVKYLENDFNN